MTRYKGRTSAKVMKRDFPFVVQISVPRRKGMRRLQERPEDRKFDLDLKAYVLNWRHKLVSAGRHAERSEPQPRPISPLPFAEEKADYQGEPELTRCASRFAVA